MRERYRHYIQAAATVLTNAHVTGFFTGKIYQGPGKHVCVPGLNCYSCPGAVGSCPIGSLQAVLGGRTKNVSYYVVGTLILFGALFGRLICGFLCPFGFIQELLYKIKSRKVTVPPRLDKPLRWGKYLALAMVILMPILVTDPFGLGAPAFCKYICPAGTLEGGIPLLIANPELRAIAGWLFSWKMAILVIVIAASILIYRPFCKYLCPLGAIYGLLNKWSLYQMDVDDNRCTHCGACERRCPMGVKVTQNINSAECIRCGACREVCPAKAINSGFAQKSGKAEKA